PYPTLFRSTREVGSYAIAELVVFVVGCLNRLSCFIENFHGTVASPVDIGKSPGDMAVLMILGESPGLFAVIKVAFHHLLAILVVTAIESNIGFVVGRDLVLFLQSRSFVRIIPLFDHLLRVGDERHAKQ